MSSQASTAPNILLLFSDEHSFRFMGHRAQADGGEPVQTPNFDKLAARGTVFNNAYCQMPLCTPSRICMLTGREARNAGAWDNNAILDPALPTIPRVLGAAGYTTALIGKMHFGGSLQFNGFQHRPYGDLTGKTGHQWEPIDAEDRNGIVTRTRDAGVTGIPESRLQDEVVATETVAFLREQQAANPQKPWFACASFSRPHFPLTAPRRWFERYWPDNVTAPRVPPTGDAFDHPMSVGMREGFEVERIEHEEMMRARAGYFACVSYLDEVIGDMLLRLDASGLLDNTIIVYTTDHGEMAGEHGTWWKNGWYEACTHIPMIVSTPAQRRGEQAARAVDTPVALIDLFPSFCALAGVAQPDNLDGADLSAAITGDAVPPERPIFTDALLPRWGTGTEFRSIRWRNYKYVRFRNAPELFFNLADDPDEQHNMLYRATNGDKDALDYLQTVALESIDFDAAEEERKRWQSRLEADYALPIDRGILNQFITPGGKLIEADDTIYAPHVLAENPADVFADWPDKT